jgi:hypothetical protein
MTKMRLQDHVDIIMHQLGRRNSSDECLDYLILDANVALKRPGAKKC